MQLIIVVEDVRQIKHLELFHAQRTKLGQRWCQHLDGTQLQRFHLFLVFIQGAVGVHFHLHFALGVLLGLLLEVFSGQSFRGVIRHNMAELDDNRLLRHGPGRTGRQQRCHQQFHLFHSSLLCF